jgi:hypothetical protein
MFLQSSSLLMSLVYHLSSIYDIRYLHLIILFPLAHSQRIGIDKLLLCQIKVAHLHELLDYRMSPNIFLAPSSTHLCLLT